MNVLQSVPHFTAVEPMFPHTRPDDITITVGGLPLQEPAWVYLHSGDRLIGVTLPVAADGADIGVLTFPDPPADLTQVALRMTNPLMLAGERPQRADGITLIAMDASVMYLFQSDTQGNAVGEDRETASVKVAPGEYYVMPGLAVTNYPVQRLVQRLRAGEDLTGTAVPRITVAAGQPASLTFDPVAAENVVLDLDEKRKGRE